VLPFRNGARGDDRFWHKLDRLLGGTFRGRQPRQFGTFLTQSRHMSPGRGVPGSRGSSENIPPDIDCDDFEDPALDRRSRPQQPEKQQAARQPIVVGVPPSTHCQPYDAEGNDDQKENAPKGGRESEEEPDRAEEGVSIVASEFGSLLFPVGERSVITD
jgi:hypothetical protein